MLVNGGTAWAWQLALPVEDIAFCFQCTEAHLRLARDDFLDQLSLMEMGDLLEL